MDELSKKEVAQLTLSIAILQFMDYHGTAPSSMMVRAAPDFFRDIVGEEKFVEALASKRSFVFYGAKLVPDTELTEGLCTIGWNH
ncbi:MAG: hypothetical protein SVK08_02970 [Halobacteriota archaeon]|nr:hypothetical protein [Halobacteriota archaeon]